MCGIKEAVSVLSPLGSVFVGASQQRKQLRAQEAAQRANIASQTKLQGDAAKAEANARRTPNYGAMFAANAEKRGVASTLLTGPAGVSGSSLALGRSTLLGG